MLKVGKRIGMLTIILLSCWLSFSEASTKLEGIDNFPESYRPYLRELNQKYANWKFIALYTNLDWNYVIENENVFGKNLVPKSYSDAWKNTTPGQYNVEVDAGWVDSSKQAVEYAMDPRNFLNEARIFQFETLSYEGSMNQKDVVERILYGTEFYQRKVSYLEANGNTVHTDKMYSDLILSGGSTSQVSPFHLASRIKQEVGPFLSHASIRGNIEGFEGLYNFYNIGATSSSEPMGAIKKGLRFAKDGNGASQETKEKYWIPWNTKERAITGGGIFIGSGYINRGQNTIYLQKFDVNDDKGGDLFWHQYMTNVLAPYSESKSIYNGYQNSGILNSEFSFLIPVYNNMPEDIAMNPNISKNDFETDNTKVYVNITSGTLNVRTGPGTSYEVITKLGKEEVVTRIGKGRQNGERWDKVKLENGMVGYIFQSYLIEVPQAPEVQVNEIKLSMDKTKIQKGERVTLNVEVLPEDAKNKKVTYHSDKQNVAVIDAKGNILGVGSGKSVLTVTAEANGVSSSIELEVYSPVTDLQLEITNLTLQVGQDFTLHPVVYPSDANNPKVQYESSNTEVVEVDATGIILAKQEGNAQVKVKTEEGNFEKIVDILVIPEITQEELSWDESLTIHGNEISGLNSAGTTVKQLKDKINTTFFVEICDKEGKVLGDDELVGTGAKIRFYRENQELVIEYQVILYGDVNGDGKINTVDLLVLQRHILEIEKFQGIFLKAGNIHKNGKNPSSLDSLLIQRYILGYSDIEQ